MTDRRFALVDEIIHVQEGDDLLPVPSPCCQAPLARPLLVTAICLGCGQPAKLDLIDWDTVRGDADARSRIASRLAQ